jgi:hypothetical protein
VEQCRRVFRSQPRGLGRKGQESPGEDRRQMSPFIF